jgi:hypothetical protein
MRLDKNERSEVCGVSRIIPGAERRGIFVFLSFPHAFGGNPQSRHAGTGGQNICIPRSDLSERGILNVDI